MYKFTKYAQQSQLNTPPNKNQMKKQEFLEFDGTSLIGLANLKIKRFGAKFHFFNRTPLSKTWLDFQVLWDRQIGQ